LVVHSAGGNYGDAASALVEFVDGLDRFHYRVLHREHLAFETVFADGENPLLYFVEKIADLILLFVSAAHAFGGGGDDGAQNVFVPDDFEVIAEVRGRRYIGKEARYHCGAAAR